MKIKLIAVAALAVCGSSAFAATAAAPAANVALCVTAPNTALGLVNYCAPEAIVNIMGATAQQPAINALLSRADNAVFDTTRPLAVVTNSDAGGVASNATTLGVGAKNTTIFYGYGAGAYDSKTNPNGGKRLAVVANFSNGSFSGMNAMINIVKSTGTAKTEQGTVFFNETLTTKLLTPSDAAAMSCDYTGDVLNGAKTPVAPTINAGTPSGTTAIVACSAGSARTAFRDYVNETDGKLPRGVQMVTLDVPPEFATPGVLSTSYKAASFPLVETGVQGFGIAVNDKLLVALIKRDMDAGKLGNCSAVTGFKTLTPACQPSISRNEVAQFVNGKGNASTLFGSGDTTPVVYYRRSPFSGTQAVSNIVFGGQGVSLALDKALKSYATTGYTTPVIGTTFDSNGNSTWTGTNGLTVKGMVGSGDVLTGIGKVDIPQVGTAQVGTAATATAPASSDYVPASSDYKAAVTGGNQDNYALGLVSLEKTGSFGSSTSTGIDKKGGAWVKVDGISPNVIVTTTTTTGANPVSTTTLSWDAKQRAGFANGYPLQFNTVVAKNNATTDAGKVKVVTEVIKALKDPAYNLPGVVYTPDATDTATIAAATANGSLAKYTRTMNAYAPLSLR